MSLNKIMKASYPQLLKAVMNRLLYMETDSIVDLIIRLYVKDVEDPSDILMSDKFAIAKKLWQATMEVLYEEYLPGKQYSFDWKIEATPYALMLCEFTRDNSDDREVDKVKELLKVSDQDIEDDFHSILGKLGLADLSLGSGLQGIIPESMIPVSKKEHLKLLFRLMNFPPLADLSYFLGLFDSRIHRDMKKLGEAFTEVERVEVPSIDLTEPLHFSYFHVSHATFQKHGVEELLVNPALSRDVVPLTHIKDEAEKRAPEFVDEAICPCCGKPTTVRLPEEILQYKFLLEHKELCRKVGLLFYDEFKEDYKNRLSERLGSFIPELNKVENPDCLILVEGDSEEVAIPIAALKKGFVLASQNIQVYNSKSKQKLREDFLNFKAKYPSRKMVCLLDSDADKERQDIERVIRDNRDKYHLVFIKNGTFEDIFDLDLSIQVLNELYPEGDALMREDFIPGKDFLSNVGRLMHHKKKAHFNKVLFAKVIALKMSAKNIPAELSEAIEKAREFTAKGNFLKK